MPKYPTKYRVVQDSDGTYAVVRFVSPGDEAVAWEGILTKKEANERLKEVNMRLI